MIEAVAIGGSHDRLLLKGYPGERTIQVFTRVLPLEGFSPLEPSTFAIETEIYRLERVFYTGFDSKPKEPMYWHFWVHESLSLDDAYVRLMEGYSGGGSAAASAAARESR